MTHDMLKKAITLYGKLSNRSIMRLKALENVIIKTHGAKYSIPKKFFLAAGIYNITEFAFVFICDVLMVFNIASNIQRDTEDSEDVETIKLHTAIDNRNCFLV